MLLNCLKIWHPHCIILTPLVHQYCSLFFHMFHPKTHWFIIIFHIYSYYVYHMFSSFKHAQRRTPKVSGVECDGPKPLGRWRWCLASWKPHENGLKQPTVGHTYICIYVYIIYLIVCEHIKYIYIYVYYIYIHIYVIHIYVIYIYIPKSWIFCLSWGVGL